MVLFTPNSIPILPAIASLSVFREVLLRKMTVDPPLANTLLIQRMTRKSSNCAYSFPFRPLSINGVFGFPLLFVALPLFSPLHLITLKRYYKLSGFSLVYVAQMILLSSIFTSPLTPFRLDDVVPFFRTVIHRIDLELDECIASVQKKYLIGRSD